MAGGATIARMQPSGITAHVWSTNNHDGRQMQDLLAEAITTNSVKEPGIYLVCWTNSTHMPFGRVFTVHRVGENLVVEGGIHRNERVNRWPPKPLTR